MYMYKQDLVLNNQIKGWYAVKPNESNTQLPDK